MAGSNFLKKLFWWDPFHPKNFLTTEQSQQIREKIKEIESQAHTKIVIQVIRDHRGNLYDRAVKEFSRHKLFDKETKTGILLLISLKQRQFQILGDEHIHEKLGDDGWKKLADKLSEFFKEGKYFEGISWLLEELAEHLRIHFPKKSALEENREKQS